MRYLIAFSGVIPAFIGMCLDLVEHSKDVKIFFVLGLFVFLPVALVLKWEAQS